MLALRALTRLLGMLWMLVLALVGLGFAVYCFDGFISLGSARPDRLLSLPAARTHVGRFLDQIAAAGPTAALALLGGLVALLIGLLLLAGILRSRKERMAVLEYNQDSGTLAAKPRTLAAMGRALAEQAPGATNIARPRLKLSRRGQRGRMTVRVARSRSADARSVESAIKERLAPLSGPFHLTPKVRVRVGERGERVQ
jgi:hypothetical protein